MRTGLGRAFAAVAALALGGLPTGLPTGRSAVAADPYTVSLTVDGRTVSRGYSSVQDVQSVLSTRGIVSLVPSYTYASALNGTLSLRGLAATVVMERNSPNVRLLVPGAGIDRTFTGRNREEAQRQLRAFLGGSSPADEIYRFGEALVATTTTDPVGGSPTSLLGQSIAADFGAGTLPPGDLGTFGPRGAGWHFGGGFEYTAQQGQGTNSYALPLAVSYTFGHDGPELFLNAPLSINSLGGSESYMGSGALGLRVPVIRGEALRWAVSPAFRYGAAGSYDSGSVAASYGPSITSDLRFALPRGLTLGIGNTYAHYWTRPLDAGQAQIEYRLDNDFFRNGIWLARPVGQLGRWPVTLMGSVSDTRVTGSKFAVQSWQEYRVSASFGATAPVRATVSYIDGESGYGAWRLGLSFAF